MSEADLNHPDPWTEAEFLALDETNSRIELIDGRLWVGPQATLQHQYISDEMMRVIKPAAAAAKLRAFPAGNVHLGPDRLVSPDIAVADVTRLAPLAEASEVVMVVEITSPSNATADRVFKKALYAEARIGWYLLVEPDHDTYESVTLQLFRLHGTRYVEQAFARNGETLTLELPFSLEINTDDLLNF